jgi:acetyl esterase/lipase
MHRLGLLLCCLALAAGAAPVRGDDKPYTRKTDVVYGRKFGTALTLDVFTPKKANGAAVILVISGGWLSHHDFIDGFFKGFGLEQFLQRGYTLFAVVHGSQPYFTIPEILDDMNRAVRFIRHHAAEYGIDPGRIGITGGSAGGHLSLMQGTAGDTGKADSKDPLERTSSRVQAVGCFYPPTDFLNYGGPGKIALGCGVLSGFKAPFAFREMDPKTNTLVPITAVDRVLEIGRKISPVTHVTPDDPPTLIIHGNKDTLVPIQQAEIIIAKLKEAGVPAELVVKEGAAHGWKDQDKDMVKIADWFDKYLAKAKKD